MNLSRSAVGRARPASILVGTNGLLTGTNLPNHNASAVTTYANYRAQFAYGRVDGTYASTVGDIRSVVGSHTYAHASGVFRSTNAGDRAALEDIMSVTAGVKVSAHVPAAASNKQNGVIRLGSRRDMVAPIWEGVTLIPDEITKAANGQIVVTAVMLHAVKILRAAGLLQAANPARLNGGNVLLSGPAGASKSALARRLLIDHPQLAVLADFQLVYRALTDDERGRDGRYPLRRRTLVADNRICAASDYHRRCCQRYRRHRNQFSDGSPERRAFLLAQLGEGAVERIVDPGENIVRARLSDA